MPRTLDHVVLCVSGLEQARESYRALGFSLTPPATHPFGTRNSLVQLPGRNFLELLALDETVGSRRTSLPIASASAPTTGNSCTAAARACRCSRSRTPTPVPTWRSSGAR